MNRSMRGQALAEFALVLPLIVLLIFGAIELGRAVYTYNTVANAARQGARVAAVNQKTGGGVCDPLDRSKWSITVCTINAGIDIGITSGDINLQLIPPAGPINSCTQRLLVPPCIARVTVNYTYVPFTPLIGDLIGNLNLSSTSEMPVEAWYP